MPTKISKMARLSNKILYASLKKESYGCANKALNTNLKLIQQDAYRRFRGKDFIKVYTLNKFTCSFLTAMAKFDT